jgi:hypothetical protein
VGEVFYQPLGNDFPDFLGVKPPVFKLYVSPLLDRGDDGGEYGDWYLL